MKIVVVEEFTGHPGAPEDQTERRFRVGDQPTDLSEDYVAMLVGKGLVGPAPAEPEAPAAEPAAEAPAAEPAEAEIPTPRTKRAPR